MRDIIEEALVWAAMSRLWPYPELEPFFQNADESKFLFIYVVLLAFLCVLTNFNV